jgi:hypothetical protein
MTKEDYAKRANQWAKGEFKMVCKNQIESGLIVQQH